MELVEWWPAAKDVAYKIIFSLEEISGTRPCACCCHGRVDLANGSRGGKYFVCKFEGKAHSACVFNSSTRGGKIPRKSSLAHSSCVKVVDSNTMTIINLKEIRIKKSMEKPRR
eukprot:PhF_6_TR1490/c0_g1_i1/m.2693